MRFNPRLVAAGLLTGLIVSSCSVDPVEIPQSELYTRQFIKTFGLFDNTNDWNTAQQGSITVDCPNPSTVKIYGNTEDGQYCFATFKGVVGKKTLTFDVPKGCENYIVRVNGRSFTAKQAASLDIAQMSASLAIATPSVECSQDIKNAKYFSVSDITSYRTHLPEGHVNLGEVTQNFTFNATQDIIIYPAYFNSSANVEFGIYYRTADQTDPEDFQYFPICCAKGGHPWDDTDHSYNFTTLEMQNPWGNDGDYIAIGLQSPDASFEDLEKYGSLAFRSKGIAVRLTTGLTYGFYVEHDEGGHRFFSEAQFNDVITDLKPDMPEDNDADWLYHDGSYFGIYETTDEQGNPRMVLGCEDWHNGDFDLNDFVVFIDRLDPDSNWPPFEYDNIDESGPDYEWVVACEDLGTLDDFDFNDVVFAVGPKTQQADGSYTVDITALASGGTLPAYLYYGDPANGGRLVSCEKGEEWHQWFGVDDYTQMINTRSLSHTGAKTTLTVDENFSLSCCVDPQNGLSNMGGFHVMVDRSSRGGEMTTEVIAATHPESTDEVARCPQMLCLPYHWMWPTERTGIQNAYTTFNDWVTEKTVCTEWHKSYVPGTVIVRKISSGGSSSTGNQGSQSGNPANPYTTGTPFTGAINVGWDISYDKAFIFKVDEAALHNVRKVEVRVNGRNYTGGNIIVKNVVTGQYELIGTINEGFTSEIFEYAPGVDGAAHDGTKLNAFKRGLGEIYITLTGCTADFGQGDVQAKVVLTRSSNYDDSDVWDEIEKALNPPADTSATLTGATFHASEQSWEVGYVSFDPITADISDAEEIELHITLPAGVSYFDIAADKSAQNKLANDYNPTNIVLSGDELELLKEHKQVFIVIWTADPKPTSAEGFKVTYKVTK